MARSRHPSAVEQEDGAGGGDMARCWNREVHVVVRGPGGEVMRLGPTRSYGAPHSSRRVVEVVVTWPGPGGPSALESRNGRVDVVTGYSLSL